eukprot:3289575-Rhodomonas_salina.2
MSTPSASDDVSIAAIHVSVSAIKTSIADINISIPAINATLATIHRESRSAHTQAQPAFQTCLGPATTKGRRQELFEAKWTRTSGVANLRHRQTRHNLATRHVRQCQRKV